MAYVCTVEDEIVIFRFANGRINVIGQETLKGLEAAIDRVNSEETLKGIILTGEGKYFSSGFDLNTFTSFQSRQEILDWFNYEEEVMLKLFTCSKPVICAANGHATAAGMIVSMACDYRMVLNNPKIKLGMTEIKIGLALTPAEGEIMRFGLDTDKKFRDVIFKGEMFGPQEAVEREIFDELAETPEALIAGAKAKVCSLIDTPGRPFILLKHLEKNHAAEYIRRGIHEYDFDLLVKTFSDPGVLGTLNMMKKALGI